MTSGNAATARVSSERLFPGVTVDQVASVHILDDEGKTIELGREDGEFVVKSAAGYPADEEKVEKLLEKVCTLRAEGVVARSEGSHGGLGLKEGKAEREVTLRNASGDELLKLLLGRAVAGGQFVRVAGETEVHRVSETLTWQCATYPSNYMDTQLIEFEVDKAQEQRVDLPLRDRVVPGLLAHTVELCTGGESTGK
ncbi:DUF4340 domain-containing protein [Planctomycetota bacterium]